MKIGTIDVYPVSAGYFRLDGGAMFGVVPRVLWEKRAPPDDKNRIKMGLWCLLIKTGNLPNGQAGKNILVNTGIGDKYNQRFQDIFGIQHPPSLISSLAEHNISPTDIDVVIMTHLHFDHCGGGTIYQNNKIIPTFPKAKYIVQKAEWEKAVNPNERTRASYIKENLLPVKESGQLELIDGATEILPGISVRVTGGHTRGHQIVFIKSGGHAAGKSARHGESPFVETVADKTAVYWSDLIPTTAHIDLPYIMGYDLYPEETLEEKRRLIELAVKEEWICFWEHDPVINCGYIRKDAEGKLTLDPVRDG